ncbi:hypothetical protein OIDMADRAFT_58216 [Oidiodendron maius Zn]|uniref:MADS-box domain-containing protein n=1 Tax=Oidiodendron maius (strain Zn) TaxID=913774 RepID=A0A0C3D3Z3_OIDMZ|nr:hypothetical protein OIDMADRAFT_58216 [Oidiodendron maius Zn]
MASKSERVAKNVKQRQRGVMKKADDVHLMDRGIMAATVFWDGDELLIYKSREGWLHSALQDSSRVKRTAPKNLRLADIHEEAEQVLAQATQPADPGLGIDLILPDLPEETLFVPAPMLETPRPSTPGGRRQLRPRPSIAGRAQVTPRKRNYSFDTDAESEGET